MIKAICFDLDGVLIDACDWHKDALNLALETNNLPTISEQDHIERFNGLPTKSKLTLLGLDPELIEKVSSDKQRFTLQVIEKKCKWNEALYNNLWHLQNQYSLALVSNSILNTILVITHILQIDYSFQTIISNEDIVHPKPNPEGYKLAMNRLGVQPHETLIVEDSDYGVAAAKMSGAHILHVKNAASWNLDIIENRIKDINNDQLLFWN